jgi:hypothetical protein
MFDRLTDGRGTTAYVVVLAVKILAAIGAFWLAGAFARRRVRRTATPRWRSPVDRAWAILALGAVAFVLGVILSALYPTGVGQP